jgi:hypothetical protein
VSILVHEPRRRILAFPDLAELGHQERCGSGHLRLIRPSIRRIAGSR